MRSQIIFIKYTILAKLFMTLKNTLFIEIACFIEQNDKNYFKTHKTDMYFRILALNFILERITKIYPFFIEIEAG